MGSHYQLVVQEQNASYKHIGEYDYEYPSCKTTDDLKDVVLERITSGESLPEDLKSWGEHADDIQIQVYKVVQSQAPSKPSLTVVLVVSKVARE